MRPCPTSGSCWRWNPGTVTAVVVAIVAGCLAGCSSNRDDGAAGVTPAGGGEEIPQFTLAWSEYPSWSAFGVAAEEGLLDGDAGALGELEKKWGVDVVLEQKDYEPCLGLYADGRVDAVCITNIDILPLSAGRPAVVTLPTSTSDGGDACLAVGVDSVAGLKSVQTRGLADTVSEYVFVRCLEERGEDPADYPYGNMDPADAGVALRDGRVESIVVWNPFLLSAERDVPAAKRLFDSSEIPEEVIDLVAIGRDSLEKPGGPEFAACLADAFHEFNERLKGPKADDLLVALGEKFSKLGLEDMKTVTTQTRFYADAAAAKALIENPDLVSETMPRVAAFHKARGMEAAPTVGVDDPDADLNFTAEYLDLAVSGPAAK